MSIDNANAGDAAAILAEAGFETLTDEMVGRLAQAASQGLDVLDDLQRHRISEVLPIVGELTASGDLARLARLARLVGAAEDTLTDEMVGRLAQAASQGLDVLDDLQRHRISEVLPIVGELTASGDLARLVRLARLVGAAEDAMTDDLVTRLAGLASRTMTILDHVTRADDGRYARIWERLEERLTPALVDRVLKALPALLDLFERVTASGILSDLAEGAERLQGELANAPRPGGGLGGLWALFKDADNQRVLQALLLYARRALKIEGPSAPASR